RAERSHLTRAAVVAQLDQHALLVSGRDVEATDVLPGGAAVRGEGVDALRGYEFIAGLEPQTAQPADVEDGVEHVVVDEHLPLRNGEDLVRGTAVVGVSGVE